MCLVQVIRSFAVRLKTVNNVTYLQSRTQLQAHVLHHHITVEEEECFAIDFLVMKKQVKM